MDELRARELPSVGVVIPTLNSARTLARCLDSVTSQTFLPSEIVVVDAFSKDSTPSIAARVGRVIQADCGMTGARLRGALGLSSDYVLSLDSDQVLAPNAVLRALRTHRQAVALGESSTGGGLVATINKWDQATYEHEWRQNLDPFTGPIRPRFYERDLLINALEAIPDSLRDLKPAPYSEDSLIFMNSKLDPSSVGYVAGAITHLEEQSMLKYLYKWFNYGRSAQVYRGTELEALVLKRGGRSVGGMKRLCTYPALIMKGAPFYLGYHL